MGTTATKADFVIAKCRINAVMKRLGIQQHSTKANWDGSRRVEHLGVAIDSVQMKFYEMPVKAPKIQKSASVLLTQVSLNRRSVNANLVHSFCATFVSVSLALPCARFYKRALFWVLPKQRGQNAVYRTRECDI